VLIKKQHKLILIGLLLAISILCVIHLISGQLDISLSEMFNSLFNFDEKNMDHIIAREIRFPRMVTSLLAGASLSLAGLLMQTLFKNPLAGPYVLGINSGSSLLVAISIMTGYSFFQSNTGIIINAMVGAFLFGLLILAFSRFLSNNISLLLVGIMIGSFTSAFIAILQSISSAMDLKLYTLWGLGSLQKVTIEQLPFIAYVLIAGMIMSILISKRLNIMILGESEAKVMGVNVRSMRYIIIGITALLTGVITAFCGPIAFIGLAVPNIARIIFKTQNQLTLILGSILLGGVFLVGVDIIIQMLESWTVIPVNALTSIIGAPIVVLIILRKLK
jgi:iron complex transport system permease protein